MKHAKMLAFATATLLAGLPVAAHAHLVNASPPIGGTISAPPKEISIDFSEMIQQSLSWIEVDNGKGVRVDKGDVRVAPERPYTLAVSLMPLPSGSYKVLWHATSAGMHKMNGSYIFELTK